jgi:hypothetical protein
MRNLTERLESAVVYLAGHGTIKDRLIDAYDKCLADLTEDDFPGELRADFAELVRASVAQALPGERRAPGAQVAGRRAATPR